MVTSERGRIMGTVNTTDGVVRIGPQPAQEPVHRVNTTSIYEEDLIDLDADEVLHCVAAAGWYATFEDGHEEPLVLWAVRESDKGHGVVVEQGEAGPRVDAGRDVSKRPGFAGYKYIGGIDND